jgi:prepilin-type N-terminal cleavage/methylation domain-containing protein
MRAWLRNQRGFTAAELLVVTAMIGLVMAGIFALQQQGQFAYLMGSNRVETQQNARVALDIMTRELRTATSITAIPSATSITFVDQNGTTIQYSLAAGTLTRTVGGVATPLIGGVQSLTMTYYSVYDVSTATYTATTNAAQVRVIKVALVTGTEDGSASGSPGDQHATVESMIRLRTNLT